VQVSGPECNDSAELITKHFKITPAEAEKLLVCKYKMKSFDIDLKILKRDYEHVPENISDEDLVVYVKAYLLYLLGTLLFGSKSFGSILSFYLYFIELDDIDSYAWGAAVIATLKVSMGDASKKLNSGESKAATLEAFSYALWVRHLSIGIQNHLYFL